MITTIQIDTNVKEKLDHLKVHHRESYNELIRRLINNCNPKNMEKENLIETLEIMSDPETMRDIAIALENVKRGKIGKSLEQIKKELD